MSMAQSCPRHSCKGRASASELNAHRAPAVGAMAPQRVLLLAVEACSVSGVVARSPSLAALGEAVGGLPQRSSCVHTQLQSAHAASASSLLVPPAAAAWRAPAWPQPPLNARQHGQRRRALTGAAAADVAPATGAAPPVESTEPVGVQGDGASAGGHTAEEDAAAAAAAAAAKAQSKAEARKAKRVPPTVITPPRLPAGREQLLASFSNGALLIDKPLGWTSFDVCGKLRNTLKFLGVKKVGHAGTLDPLASGLLVVATGAGTKFCDDFMALDKEYSGTIRLGQGTRTYDAEGEVDERAAWEHITDEQVQQAAASFLGDSLQVPPMYSAIKVGGRKLYDLAREGETIERTPRPIHVSSFRVWREPAPSPSAPPKPVAQVPSPDAAASDGEAGQDSDPRSLLRFHVACSKGTYVRSLAYDLGRRLGSVAHLASLRREAVGELHVRDAWQLQDLLQQLREAKEGAAGAAPTA